MREVRESGYLDQLPKLAANMAAGLAPAPTQWLADRLSLLWLSMGNSKADDVATAWLHETSRLLSDLPQDICADAIDEAVKASTRGFMPAIGEIRKYADPMLAKRRRALSRLNSLINFRADKPAEVENIQPGDVIVVLEQTGFADVAAKLAGKIAAERPPRRAPNRADYLAMGVAEGDIPPSAGSPEGRDGEAGSIAEGDNIACREADGPNHSNTRTFTP